MAAFRCSLVAVALFELTLSAQALKNIAQLSACCPQECQDQTVLFQETRSTFNANEELAGAMDYGSYCMRKCQPAENTGLSCFMTDAEKEATDARVALLGGSVESEQAGDRADKQEALQQALLAKNDQQEEEKGLEETGAMVAEAEGKKASAMAIETKAAMAEASAAQARATALIDLKRAENRGGIVEDIQAQLIEASERAHLFAQTALNASKQAAADLEALKHVHEVAAQEAAKMAVAQLNFEADGNLGELAMFEANLKPPAVPPIPEQIGKAAAPYLQGAAQAGSVKQLYEAKAAAKRDEAARLRFGAERARAQEAPYVAAGRHDLVNKIRSTASDLLMKSQEADGAALDAEQEAERIGATLPKYMGLAGAAVGRATILGEQKWMPPAIGS